jgi:carbon-monoxide dehydrogenase medium subunit
MLLPKFDFHRPASLAETCEILAAHGKKAKLVAGGTDLLVNLKKKLLTPSHVVAMDDLKDLEEIRSSKQAISLGARYTIAGLCEHRTLRNRISILVQAAGKLGSPLIRNRATVGGNIVTARPASDMAPPLMALEASVILESKKGKREVALNQFFTGPGASAIKPDEVLTRIEIPAPQPGTGGGYEKLGLRRAMEIGIVNSAAVLTLDSSGKKIASARVVLGSVAPTPIRSPEAEKILTGAPANQKTLVRAAQAAVGDSCAIDDMRGTIEYRCLMVEVLTRRALETALNEALGK